MPYARTDDGIRIYYETHGEGTPLVLAYGIGGNADLWDVNVGGEYKFANSGWSTFAKYTHSESDDLADLNADAVKVGLRYTFGGSLKDRDRAGADLISAGDLFGFGVR